VAAIGVIVGVVLTVLELRHLRKQRQTDLVMRLRQRFQTKEFLESWEQVMSREAGDFDEYAKKYGFPEMMQVAGFFDEIGILLHRKLIDIDLVYELFNESIDMIWKKIEPLMKDGRKRLNQPTWGEWFEYLYNEMKKREQKLQQSTAKGE
jgi:hypothetical protein